MQTILKYKSIASGVHTAFVNLNIHWGSCLQSSGLHTACST